MRNLKVFFILISAALLISSCAEMQTITVFGPNNTKIFSPEGECIGKIGNNQYIKLELSRNHYTPFLLSQAGDTGMVVPFAVDFRRKSSAGLRTLEATGWAFTGTIILCLPGICMWGPAEEALRIHQRKYQYKYNERQNVNSIMQFTQPVFEQPPVVVDAKGADSRNLEKEQSSEKSTRTLKNWAGQVAGIYTGSGSLKQNGATIESYTNMRIEIKQTESNTVSINVIESNGIPFFGEASLYTVSRDGDSFMLTHKSIPSASIRIGKDRKLSYIHPRVNIDGDIYTLSINASKK